MGCGDADDYHLRAVCLDECSLARIVEVRLLNDKREDDPRPVRCPADRVIVSARHDHAGVGAVRVDDLDSVASTGFGVEGVRAPSGDLSG